MKKIYIPSPEEIADKYFMIIPNIFFDEFMPRLTPSAWKILTFFLRQTYGFKRERYSVGIHRIAEGTGLGAKTVSTHLQPLLNAGLLVITKEADRRSQKTREYRLIQGDLFI